MVLTKSSEEGIVLKCAFDFQPKQSELAISQALVYIVLYIPLKNTADTSEYTNT